MPEFELTPAAPDILHQNPQVLDDGDDFVDEPEREPEPAARRGREGLPARFQMRHAPHYVEQLMGQAPIQTVRQVPIGEIHAPAVDPARITRLTASVRKVGVLQPLLVAHDAEAGYALLSGSHRLQAAREAGLKTVPCLVLEAVAGTSAEIRAEAACRAGVEPPPVSAATPSVPAEAPGEPAVRAAFGEIGGALEFVGRLLPLASAGVPAFRGGVVSDLIAVEAARATSLATAASLLVRTDALRLESIDCRPVLEALRQAIGLAARLKGVALTWPETATGATFVADREAVMAAWPALLHAAVAMARAGDQLCVSVESPRLRPALVINATIKGRAFRTADLPRLADCAWEGHPGGQAAAVMLAAADRCARLHGGRLGIVSEDTGIQVSLIVPQPLARN